MLLVEERIPTTQLLFSGMQASMQACEQMQRNQQNCKCLYNVTYVHKD